MTAEVLATDSTEPSRMPARGPDVVIGTAEGACFARATAAREPDPSVANPDFLAKHFLGFLYRNFASLAPLWLARRVFEWRVPGAYAGHLARTRHCDRALHRALAGGAEQLVVLGAGYDTRAYRFRNELAGIPVFEVDLPGTQARKQQCLRALYRQLPAHVRYVPIDFATQDLATQLSAAGYDPGLRTHFIWEGVTYYIDDAAVRGVLSFACEHAARGSTLTFDYWLRRFVDGDLSGYGARELVRYAVEELKEPFLFGLEADELGPYVGAFGLEVTSDVGPAQLSMLHLRRADGSLVARPWDVIRIADVRTV